MQKDRDQLSANEIDNVAKVAEQFLQFNGIIFVFCSDKQIGYWINAFIINNLKLLATFLIIKQPSFIYYLYYF